MINKEDIVKRRDIFEAYMPEQEFDPELISTSLLQKELIGLMDDMICSNCFYEDKIKYIDCSLENCSYKIKFKKRFGVLLDNKKVKN